jgi:L-iditol 2-dehydrogenase
MKVAVLEKVRTIRYEQRPVPAPKENEVLVRMKHVGVCGSDIHYYEHGRIGSFVVEKPLVLGHEGSGEIVATGSGVTHLRPGTLVLIEPGYGCGRCEYCKTGRYNLCRQVIFMATPPVDGCFCEYVAYPADMVHPLPPGMGTLEAALSEPFVVGLYTAGMGQPRVGQSAFVYGCGCIGLSVMLALRAMGITEIYMSDLLPVRLKKAGEIGATAVFNGRETDLVEEIARRTGGAGVDVVYEAAGSVEAVRQSIDLVKAGGKIVVVGMAADFHVNFDFARLIAKEVVVQGVFRYRNAFPAALKAVAAGIDPVRSFDPRIYDFSDVPRAMEDSVVKKSEIIKSVVQF